MEATGDYWRGAYYLLEDTLNVILVNTAHAKGRPGRKTDVSDSAWLGAWVGNNFHDHLWRKKLRIRLPGSGCPNFWDVGPSWWSASSDSPVGLALRTHAPSPRTPNGGESPCGVREGF